MEVDQKHGRRSETWEAVRNIEDESRNMPKEQKHGGHVYTYLENSKTRLDRVFFSP